jgi:hypothetical protein
MNRPITLALAGVTVLLAASPSMAFSLSGAPVNPNSGARIVDPDAAHPHLASESGVQGARDVVAEAKGPMVRYDLSPAGKHVRPREDALDSRVADLADPRNNPFAGVGE